MKSRHIIYCGVALICFLRNASAQVFVNLDFEEANVPPTPTNTLGNFVNPSLAFPGWTVLPNGTTFGTSVAYNDVSLGGPAITLIGPDFPGYLGYEPLEGCYSVLLQYFGIGNPPALSQTGFIPPGTTTISILGNAVIEINGVNIPLNNGSGNISAFAGQTVQLTITTPHSATVNSPVFDYFDDIEFSPVPEPSVMNLTALCVLFALGSSRSRRLFCVAVPPRVASGRATSRV